MEFPFKDCGLIKQSLSVTTANHRKLHLICYYSKEHVTSGQLKVPSYDSFFSNVRIPEGLYPDMTTDLFGRHEDTRFAHSDTHDIYNVHPQSNVGKSSPMLSSPTRTDLWGHTKIAPSSTHIKMTESSLIYPLHTPRLPSPPSSQQKQTAELDLPPLKLPRLPSLALMADTHSISTMFTSQPTIPPLVVPTPNISTSEDRRQLANLSAMFSI
ncbi:Gluconate transport-inducing protein [Basidiobolus ranarum]|uniref:Gluconate transport-inducing protein n=1 Tax=Basidiobolus ranarum TaxID=34480 RepID=A0ABR2VWV1_9FUNG